MRRAISLLLGMSLITGSVAAQEILYENPYDPSSGNGDCHFTDACSDNFSGQLAQSFTLTAAATVQAVSFVVSDPYQYPLRYSWSIFSSANGLPAGPPGPISLPTDTPTVLPIISSPDAVSLGNGQPGTYTYQNLIQGTGIGKEWVNEVTIDTGNVTLGAGTYSFALLAYGSEITYEGWDTGIYASGAATGNFNVWSTDTAEGSLAMTVIGAAAPEVDSSLAATALTLLLGGVTVLRGRRTR